MKKNIWYRITCIAIVIIMLFANMNFVFAADDEANPEWYEKLFAFFIIVNGYIFREIISITLGADLSIDALVFDRFPQATLTLFNADNKYYEVTNPLFQEGAGAVEGINHVFGVFQQIATIIYIVILVYMGIRIILVSTADKKARFKQFLVDWVKGVAILFLFPYVIRYTILLNHAIVTYIDDKKDEVYGNLFKENSPSITQNSGKGVNEAQDIDFDNIEDGSNYMDHMFFLAKSDLYMAYAICWFIMLIQLVQFWIVYMMRLIKVVFLIAIFPLVTISYAIDKIGDGKSQAFDHWFKEFVLEVFVQTFHAINYVIVMGIVFKFAPKNWLLAIIGITYVIKGSDIIKSLFAQMRGGGAGGPMSLAGSLVKAQMLVRGAKTISGVGRRIVAPITKGANLMGLGSRSFLNASVARSRNKLSNYARATGNSSTVMELVQQSPHVTVKRNEEDLRTLLERANEENLSDADIKELSTLLAHTRDLAENFEGALNKMGLTEAQKESLRVKAQGMANAGRAAIYLTSSRGRVSNVDIQQTVDVCMRNMTNPNFSKTMKAHGIDGVEGLKNIAAQHSVSYDADKRAERLARESSLTPPSTQEEKIKYYTNAIKNASFGEHNYQELMGYTEYLENIRATGDESAKNLVDEEMSDATYSLEQFKANLAVQTINNSRDIDKDSRQDCVDAAIRVVNDIKDDPNYAGILAGLKTNIDGLHEGFIPTVDYKDPLVAEKAEFAGFIREKLENKEVDLGQAYDAHNDNYSKEMTRKGAVNMGAGAVETGFGMAVAPWRAAGDAAFGVTALGANSSGKGGFNPLAGPADLIPQYVDVADSTSSALGRTVSYPVRRIGRGISENVATSLEIGEQAYRKNEDFYEDRATQEYVRNALKQKNEEIRFLGEELKKWKAESDARKK